MYMKCKEASRAEADQNWIRIGITMWTIWKARNNHVYNNIEPNPESTINHARIIEKEYNSLIKENISKVREDNKGGPLPVIWRPPPIAGSSQQLPHLKLQTSSEGKELDCFSKILISKPESIVRAVNRAHLASMT
ncbi:hypothetical protein Ahy_A03g011443 [Arachis hypogaea]|uniref:Uncharacterized protein n=1 Tax=Arachis hypogaea TaxID=3818 RepID=A0A445DQP9_ARAHY|nr:hypothetical protein Ahy_A03g011443 [Arachis hypogaea]